MSSKPTYQELEQQLTELKAEAVEQAAVLANIPLFMIIVDAERRVRNASRTVLDMTGRSMDRLAGLRGGEAIQCVHHLDDPMGCGFGPSCNACKVRQIVQDTLDTGNAHFKVEAEVALLDRDPNTRHLLVSTAMLAGCEKNVLVFIEDITDRKKSEIELREQTDFLNALLETISNPIFYKDADMRYTGCNRAFENFIGRPRSQIIGKSVYDMGPKEIADTYYEKDAELIHNPGKQQYEWKVETSDGEVRDVIFDKATLHNTKGCVTGLVGVISDITQRKRAEDRVRDLSQMLMQAQERERQMIACELHDSIAQNLSTIKLYCSRLFEGRGVHEKAGGSAFSGTHVAALIDQTIASVRDLAYNLRPVNLDHFGLTHSLSEFCEEFGENNGIRVDFQAAGVQESGMTPEMRINLYRLVMEGLNNIRKHARATEAVVRLVGAYPNVILRIQDNGIGFDVEKREQAVIREKRMGLRSMQERVNLLQGQMAIHSRINVGTEIVITLPLKDSQNGAE